MIKLAALPSMPSGASSWTTVRRIATLIESANPKISTDNDRHPEPLRDDPVTRVTRRRIERGDDDEHAFAFDVAGHEQDAWYPASEPADGAA